MTEINTNKDQIQYNVRSNNSPKSGIGIDLLMVETLGLEIKVLNGKPIDDWYVIEIAKDPEFKYTAIHDIPKNTKFITNGVWVSLAYHSIICKHPFFARSPIYRSCVAFWCKMRYYVFNETPDLDWKFIAWSIFPYLPNDNYAKIIANCGDSNPYNQRNVSIADVCSIANVSVSLAFKKFKIIFKNFIDDFFKFVSIHGSPDIDSILPNSMPLSRGLRPSAAAPL